MIKIDQSIQRFIKPWLLLLAILCVAIFYMFFDKQLALILYQAELASKIPILNTVTCLGSTKLYGVTLLLVACYLRAMDCIKNISSSHGERSFHWSWFLPNRQSVAEARVWFLIVSIGGTSIICGILKVLFGRARPMMWVEHQQFGFYWFQTTHDYWSFPSGHTTAIVSIALGLSILFPRYIKAFFLMTICIVASRVLLLQHYVSDVIATALLVVIEMAFFIGFLKSKQWFAPLFDSAVSPLTKKGRTS